MLHLRWTSLQPQPAAGNRAFAIPQIQTDPNYNPFRPQNRHTKSVSQPWERLYDTNPRPTIAQEPEPTAPLFTLPQRGDDTPLLQSQGKYIVAPADGGLLLVHQHRAHVAILYRELAEQLHSHHSITQPVLFPEVIDLSPDDWHTLQSLLADLQAVGFTLEQFSPSAYSITSVPALLGQQNASETLLQVIHQVQDTGSTASAEWQKTVALSLADRMAIPVGKTLTDNEMRDLLQRLLQHTDSRYLPNGQTIFTILTNDDLQKYF